jgi:MFS family permease
VYRPDTAIDVPWTSRRFWSEARRSVPLNVWLLGLTSLLTDVSSEMVVSVLPAYLVLGLHLSPLTYGAMDGLYSGATVVTRWLGGAVADRRGRYKGLALIGYGLSALCRAGLVLAGGAPAAIAGVIAADRVGKGIRTAPRDALISLSAPAGGLAQAFGVHRALDAAGALMGPLLAVWLLRRIPGAYDVVFVTSFAVALVGVAVLAMFVSDVRGGPRPGQGPSLPDSLALLRRPEVGRVVLAAAALGIVTTSDGLIYIALQAGIQYPIHWLPLMYAGTAATFLLLAVPAGMLADRVGRTTVFILGHVALLLVYGLLFAPLGGMTVPLLVAGLLGAYYAATDGVLMALASTVVPSGQRGGGLALVATATSLGRMGAAIVFGFVWTMWSRDIAVGTFAVALACSVVLAGWLLRAANGRLGEASLPSSSC